MPPIETLAPPTPARSRTVGLVVLRIYLLLSVGVVVVKTLEILGQ
jgi:hypothetical protein